VNATRQVVGAAALAVVLLTGAGFVHAAGERTVPLPEVSEEALLISSSSVMRRLTVGFNALAADVYWIRAIQYYGSTKRRLAEQPLTLEPPAALADTSDYQQLYGLLDITTTLDPQFNIAYRFGAVFLGEGYPTGPGRPDLAVKLLEKGLHARPDRWQYMQDIGFVYYWYVGDYRRAADAFLRAANIPGSPNWLKPLAAVTLAQGGDRRTSRAMWLSILQTADVDWLRVQAERRLRQLQALDDIDALQARLDASAASGRERLHDWRALMKAGVVRGIPVDPAGTPYELTADGRVRLSVASPLFPLPTESKPLASPPS
jgi:tetratricopeptide (TPR) repeat protein